MQHCCLLLWYLFRYYIPQTMSFVLVDIHSDVAFVFSIISLSLFTRMMKAETRRRRMSTRGPLSHAQQRTDFKTATALLCIAVSFIICQSVKIIPDIYELRNCNYLKVMLEFG